MEDFDEAENWRERLRNELLPYAAFYALGLVWVCVASSISTWAQGLGFGFFFLTALFGAPVTALVSLLMLWRVTMFGFDCGRIVPMVAALSAAAALMMAAFGAVFPAFAIGHAVAQWQQGALERSSGATTDCEPHA